MNDICFYYIRIIIKVDIKLDDKLNFEQILKNTINIKRNSAF